MTQPNTLLRFVLLLLALSAPTLFAQSVTEPSATGERWASLAQDARRSTAPVPFIPNHGQWDEKARFLARWNGLDLWVESDAIVYNLYDERMGDVDRNEASTPANGGPDAPAMARRGHVLRMKFVGARSNAPTYGFGKLPGVHNYFLGNRSDRWAVNVPMYESAVIDDLYDGVSAVVYTDGDKPRYDLLLAPGADPSQLRFTLQGATSVRTQGNDLIIGTSLGQLKQQGLMAYQMIGGERRVVQCRFDVARNGEIGFKLGSYDRSQPLVIDPLLYSTYLVADGYSRGYDIAVDAAGNAYLTGYTGSATFPTSLGAYQNTLSGVSWDVYVTKLDPDGRTVLYSTYVGGTTDEVGTAIAIDQLGMIYVAGYTFSTDFPTKGTFDATHGGKRDAFLFKLDPLQNTPAAQLVYSTFLGGTGNDNAFAIAVRASEAYVAGGSDSQDFPTLNGFQNDQVITMGAPSGEAFVARFTATGTALVASTYIGGNYGEAAHDIAIDGGGSVYICGHTYSGSFPVNGSVAAYDNTSNGNSDAFVAKFTPLLNTLVYATYLGGSDYDEANGIAVDAAGNMFVSGKAQSTNFPTTAGAYKTLFNGGGADAFVAKVAAGGTLGYSTYLGGNNDDWANEIAIDANNTAWLVGATLSNNYPTTPNAIQPVKNGTTFEVIVAAINSVGSRLEYSTFLGGTGADTAASMALHTDGYVYATGSTYSSNFPTTATAYRRTAVGGTFVSKIGVLKMSEPPGGEVYCAGESVRVRWNGTASGTYDLYLSADSGVTFTPMAFSISGSSYDWFIPIGQAAGDKYRIKVSAGATTESDLSDAFGILAPPKVNAQPISQKVAPGATAVFTAAAAGTPAPTVQWQQKTATVWSDLPGETNTTLRLTNVAPSLNGSKYRALFFNVCRVVSSDSATLTVPSVELVTPNGGEHLCAGTSDTIRWSTVANTGPVNLLLSSDAGFSYSPLAGGITKDFYVWNIPANISGGTYRVKVELTTVPTGDASNTDFVINQRPRTTKDPADVKTSNGLTATFTAQGTGTPEPTIQWEVNTGSGWEPVPNATGTTLTLSSVALSQNGHLYRAVFSNECGTDSTRPARLTVNNEPGSVEREARLMAAYALHTIPAPIGSRGVIAFNLPRAGRTSLTLMDLNGRTVARLTDAHLEAGGHRIPFSTAGLPNGIYVAELRAGADRIAITVTIAR